MNEHILKFHKDPLCSYVFDGSGISGDNIDVVVVRMSYMAMIRSSALRKPVGLCLQGGRVDYIDDVLDDEWHELLGDIINVDDNDEISDLDCDVDEADVFVSHDGSDEGVRLSKLALEIYPELFTVCDVTTIPQLRFIINGNTWKQEYFRHIKRTYTSLVKTHEIDILVHTENRAADVVDMFKDIPGNIEVDDTIPPKQFQHCCTFNKTLERVVYYYKDESEGFVLIDSNHIAVVFANFIKKYSNANLVVLPTTFANKASTDYMEENGISTAEKNDTDIVILGGGWVVVEKTSSIGDCKKLRTWLELFKNNDKGDAFVTVLAFEAILKMEKQKIQDIASLYTNIPSSHGFLNLDQVKPLDLQLQYSVRETLDLYEKSYIKVVTEATQLHIYTEASTVNHADELLWRIKQKIKI